MTPAGGLSSHPATGAPLPPLISDPSRSLVSPDLPAEAHPAFIDSDAEIAALVDQLRGQARVALDTEFHPERRYRPELMTVQVAVDDGRAWIIDARNCDMGPLSAVLRDSLVVVHGGQFDVALLQQACPPGPLRVLDTQRLAGLAGYHFPARLDDLLVSVLDHSPTRSSAVTNWAQRPLSPEQLHYAAADATCLLPLVDRLWERLQDVQQRAPQVQPQGTDLQIWAQQASQELLIEAQQPPRPLDAWRGWVIASGLSADESRILAGLATWRDGVARALNQPPHFMLGDGLMLAFARARPRCPAELTLDRRVSKGLLKRSGDAIIACISASLDGPAPPPVLAQVQSRKDLLRAWATPSAPRRRNVQAAT